jgi:phosphoribosyl 1,2-cyclic phosphodiesterase
MSLRITVLGSGSTGNSTLVNDGKTNILIDVGLSGRETRRRLEECGVSADRISAIIISHEHIDHCRGVASFSKGLEIPVFVTEATLTASGLCLPEARVQRIQSGRSFDIRGILFTPFSIPHDAADPVALTIERDGAKAAVVMDLGFMSNLVVERLKGCDGIILESNHDTRMLRSGPYPEPLKQRIRGRLGHLSNEDVADYLCSAFDGRAHQIVLAHLSQKNNLPEIALESAKRALEERNTMASNQTKLKLASADKIGPRLVF